MKKNSLQFVKLRQELADLSNVMKLNVQEKGTDVPGVPEFPGVPKMPEIPVPRDPGVPKKPAKPEFPDMPEVPDTPLIPKEPQVPGPEVPEVLPDPE